MPLYDYKCTQCGKIAEVRHGFDESHDAPCPACGAAVRRVFNAAPIVFKGSGFYVTDSRKSSPTAAPAGADASTPGTADAAKPDAPKSDAPKSDAPAATPSASESKAVESKSSESKASEPAA